MSGERLLMPSDSVEGPTGFASNARALAWALADEYDVHVLGLQSMMNNKVKISINGEVRTVTQHANYPRGQDPFDFGARSLPRLMEELNPDVLLTINDIQMIQHVPKSIYPNEVTMKLMDMPSKKMISEEALRMELDGHIQRFKEKYPLDCKWIAYCPQDGDPPMAVWNNVYAVADQVVAFCKYGKSVFQTYYGMDVPYIYHGIDVSLLQPRERTILKDKFIIGNFNRNQPRKQPVRMLEAFAKFARDKNDVLCHMQMDWRDQFGWPIDHFAGMFGIMNKMIRPARHGMPREQVSNIYNTWDVNVTPTAGEGFGLCEVEGMACGKPNIATDYTTTKEFNIDSKPSPRGISVPYTELYWDRMDVAAVRRSLIDIDKLAEAFETYYKDRDLLAQHSENAREWAVNNVDICKLQDKWKTLIKDVLNR